MIKLSIITKDAKVYSSSFHKGSKEAIRTWLGWNMKHKEPLEIECAKTGVWELLPYEFYCNFLFEITEEE